MMYLSTVPLTNDTNCLFIYFNLGRNCLKAVLFLCLGVKEGTGKAY